jgi:glycosyltransferase involved in cell wall biosynthesis
MKKIIIVTPLFPPDVGGPAKQSFYLVEMLKQKNIPYEIFVYSSFHEKKGRLGYFYFFKTLFWGVKKEDTLVVFDEMALGLVSLFVSRLRGAVFFVRVGGDRLWERAVESGRISFKTLSQFYSSGQYKYIYPFLHLLRKSVFSSARGIIFSSLWYQHLISAYLNIAQEKTFLIKNKTEDVQKKEEDGLEVYTYAYAGRFTKVKNLPFLIRSFARLAQKNNEATLLLFGSGPEEKTLQNEVAKLPPNIKNRIFIKGPKQKNESLDLIKKTKVCVLPSLSDISPNFLLECQSLGKPAVVTAEVGIREDLEGVLYADPFNESLFAIELENAAKEPVYSRLRDACQSQKPVTEWEKNWLKVLSL